MRKIVILVIIVIILIIIALFVASRRPRYCSPRRLTQAQRDDNVEVKMMLDVKNKLLSYAFNLKNLKSNLLKSYIARNGVELFPISGPRNVHTEGPEIFIHGVWRQKSSVPLTEELINALIAGEMSITFEFEDHLKSAKIERKLIQSN